MAVRYDTNPFTDELNLPISKKQVKVSPIGKDQNVLINQETGEIRGTHVTTYKKVDSEQFVKIFTANISLTFGLKAAGIKAFTILCWAVQHHSINKDLVQLDSFALAEFIEEHKKSSPPLKLSLSTFKRGLLELETAQIIAKNKRLGHFFINPNFVFNGDRIAFTQIIERDKIKDKNKLK